MRALNGRQDGEGQTLLMGPRRRSKDRSDARAAVANPTRFAACWRLCVTTLAVAAAAALAGDLPRGRWVGVAQAQQVQPVTIKVAAVLNAEAASKTPLAIQVGPQGAIAKNSFVRIRGLPPMVALSEGHAIAPGAWAVSLAALPNLSLFVPAGLKGTSEIAISLVNPEGAVLAEVKATLTVAPAASQARPSIPETRSSSTLDPPAAGPRLSPAERENALALHAKGLEQLERGNVYAARKFFERAAAVGLAQSAVAVAGTYDPDELAKLKVVGLEPDVEAARKWYEKARELGAAEAGERLRRLGSR